MDLYLRHTPQPWPWGCQYYSLFSLVGDCRLLEDVTECNSTRFEERARELGYFLFRVYADVTCTVPMPAELWEKLFGGPEGVARIAGHEVPFLIDTQSLKHRGVFHTVGLTLRGHFPDCTEGYISVRVFDPGAAGEKEYATLADFLASPYGRIYELKQVMPVDLLAEVLPRAFGPDGPHVSPDVRHAYCQSLIQATAAR